MANRHMSKKQAVRIQHKKLQKLRKKRLLYILLFLFFFYLVSLATVHFYTKAAVTRELAEQPTVASAKLPETSSPQTEPETTAPETAPQTEEIPDDTDSAEIDLSSFSRDDWRLLLVSEDFPLETEVTFTPATVYNGLQVDSRIYDDLAQMLADGEKTGLSFVICSAYRPVSQQTELFQEKLNGLQQDGLTYEEAYMKTKTSIAVPGSSEHHVGLAVDIVASSYQLLNDQQSSTPEYQWLSANCHKYGFIVRYPENRTDITGIIYEPWHFRYVGLEAAAYIAEHDLSLEEFLDLLEKQ